MALTDSEKLEILKGIIRNRIMSDAFMLVGTSDGLSLSERIAKLREWLSTNFGDFKTLKDEGIQKMIDEDAARVSSLNKRLDELEAFKKEK